MSDEFVSLARKTGLSDMRLSRALGLTGRNGAARVREWKRGARPVPSQIMSMMRNLAVARGGENEGNGGTL